MRLEDGRTPELIGYDSLPLGVVTLAEHFGHHGFDADGYQEMVDHVADRLASFERIHCIAHEVRLGGVRLLGTSGTVTTLAGVAAEPGPVSQAGGRWCAAERRGDGCGRWPCCAGLGRDGLGRHPCVGPERAEFVLPGCAIFEAIRGTWPVEDVIVADRGLREGMLLRMMRQGRPCRRTGIGRGAVRAG